MFDLFRSRQKAVRYLLGGLLLMVALSMVTYLIPGYGSNQTKADDAVLATIGSEKLTAQDVMVPLQRVIQNGRLPADYAQSYLPQMVQELIQQRAMIYEFTERQGLTVSDDEVLAGLSVQYPQYFKDGALTNREQLEQLLAQNSMTLQDLADEMRRQLLLKKVDNIIYASVVVPDKEVEDFYKSTKEKAGIQYIAFPSAKFRDQVNPTPAELHKFFDDKKASFMTPEKRTYQVLVVDQQKVEDSMTISDADLHAAYNASIDNFRVPDRVKARHILVKTDGLSDTEKKKAMAKAEDILKQAKGGADFSELAKKYSDDPGSGSKGGDLGWFVHGQMVPEFDKAAFALKPGEISGIVTSQFGYHIIKCDEKDTAHLKTFDEVKADLATELKKQKVAEKVQQVAEQAHAALMKSPKSAAEIAKQFNIDVVTVTNAAPGAPVPTLGSAPEIDSALATMKPNDVSQLITLPSNRIAMVVLDERVPPRPSTYEEVEAQIREMYITNKSMLLASEKAKEAADRLKAGEDIEKVAKSMKLEVISPPEFARMDSIEGLGLASYVKDAFTQPVGSVIGPLNLQNRDIVCKVTKQEPADMAAFPAEKDSIRQNLRAQKLSDRKNLFMDSVVGKLEAEGKVKINNDAIRKLAASLKRG